MPFDTGLDAQQPTAPPPPIPPPPVPPLLPLGPQPSSPDPEQVAAQRRRAGATVSAIGAGLLLIAAGTFIGLRWEEMGLVNKTGIVGLLAAMCLGGGWTLRGRARGTAAALVHLGVFLAALDAGAVAHLLDLGFGWTAAAGGAVGLVMAIGVPRLLGETPVLEAGRVLALTALALALANVTPLTAPMLIVGLAMTAAWLRRPEAAGLGLLAGSGPLIEWAGIRAQPGALLAWLADITTAAPIETVAIAAIAILAIVSLRRGTLWALAAAAVGAVATPSAVEVFAQHQDATLITLAASAVGARIVVHLLHRPGWLPLVDALALVTAVGAGLTGLGRVMLDVVGGPGRPIDVGLATVGALLGLGWVLSDVLAPGEQPGDRPLDRLWRGASGPIATIGLVSATLVGLTAMATATQAGVLLALLTAIVGVTRRKGAVVVLRAGLPFSALLLVGNPALALAVALLGAGLSHVRARLDLGDGCSISSAATTQFAGLLSLGMGALFTIDQWQFEPAIASISAFAIGATLTTIAWDATRLGVRELILAPRLLMPLLLLPVLFDPGQAGGVALAAAAVLVADRVLLGVRISEWLAAGNLTLGLWLIASAPWWRAEPITALDWHLFGPAVFIGLIGHRAIQGGASSWVGLGPAFGLIGVSSLAERLAGGGGWHGAAAGAIGLVALVLGVQQRWASPAVIGTALMVASVTIEVAGIVPRIPVWVLLALGGCVLLTSGWLLERAAGSGPMASLRSTWNEFG